MFLFQRNSSPLFSITRSSSFSVIHVSVNIKNNVEKDTTLLFFSLSKSRGGHPMSFQINLELHLGCHSCWLSYFILVCLSCGRTDGRVDLRSRDYQISRMHRLPNFLTHGAPLCARESPTMILLNTKGDKNRLHELHSYEVKVQQLLTITSETRAPIKRPCSFPFDIRTCLLVQL